MKGFRSKTLSANGKRGIVFNRAEGYVDMPVELPCGQCIGCRLERSRQWAMRCVHEAAMHPDNIFITLTYDNQHLPADKSLHYPDFQLFKKRLLVNARRELNRSGIRFYMCGEYGETFGRPHYHAIVFNLDLPDKKLWKMEREIPLYTSQFLTDTWGKGHASVGGVTFQSAAYVARYVMKKVTGEAAADHYSWIDPETGEIHNRTPEFTKMSLKPGIGATWFAKYKTDVFPNDFIVVNGKKVAPPKFYTSQHEILYPEEVAQIKLRRKKNASKKAADNTPERLKVRERVLESRLTQLKRTIE